VVTLPLITHAGDGSKACGADVPAVFVVEDDSFSRLGRSIQTEERVILDRACSEEHAAMKHQRLHWRTARCAFDCDQHRTSGILAAICACGICEIADLCRRLDAR
jgi:hypothetical protein